MPGHANSKERWLAAMWPRVLSRLPDPPARVVEIGCGPLGGFVPMLLDRGYQAVGIDPEAPDGASYRRVEFEQAPLLEPADAVVACTSLHHVGDAAVVVDRIAATLARGGVVVVVEWNWEAFDARTARWGFERLRPGEESWLHRHREQWQSSGLDWDAYLRGWAEQHGIHAAEVLVRLLDRRFERRLLTRAPYLFPDLADTSEADEQAAIDRGQIRATRIDYVGRTAGG
jgi:SAM-dependent methyltransferase